MSGSVGVLGLCIVRRGVVSVLGGLARVVTVTAGVSRFCRVSRMARLLAVGTPRRRWRCWPVWMPSWRRTAEELGERLAWSAAERLLREAVADAVDRKVDLKHRWAASTQDAARVKLSAELRLTEGEIARLLRGIKTDLPQPVVAAVAEGCAGGAGAVGPRECLGWCGRLRPGWPLLRRRAGCTRRCCSQQRFEHDRAGVDPRWVRRHYDDEGRWCRQFETSVEPCGHVPPHEVRCCNAGLHEDLEAGRPVVLSAPELGRFVELTPPPGSRDRRWFEVSADDSIVEVAEPEWCR